MQSFQGQVSVHYIIFIEVILEVQSLAMPYIKGRTKDKGNILNLRPVHDTEQHRFCKGLGEQSLENSW